MAEKLGKKFEVIYPEMPNPDNAKYLEWKIWFEKLFPYLRNDVVLVGHSLGGIFLVKYFSENKFPKRIAATMLVAAPYFDKTRKDLPKDWILPASLSRFEKQGGRIILYQSKDDKLVSLSSQKIRQSFAECYAEDFQRQGTLFRRKIPGNCEGYKEIKN